MESKRLLELYQEMDNLRGAEARLTIAIIQYLSEDNLPTEILNSLRALQDELVSYAPHNNISITFISESRGKLADLSIAITGFFSEEESLSRPLILLAELKFECKANGITSAVELISAIENHLKEDASSKIPTLKGLAVLESLIEDSSQERFVYEDIYVILGQDPPEKGDLYAVLSDDSSPTPFARRETAAQNILEQRILIVDDEKTIAATVGFILSDLDLPIDLVADGAAALDRLNERPYSLVISDIEMPNFDGFSLIGAMRNDFQFSDVPLIFMSNKEAYRELAIELGATDFFLKGSISGSELLEKISTILKTAPYVPSETIDE